jgi:hypothetical protein
LDRLAAESDVPHVDLIKLDVEGAEIETIEGMRGILRGRRTKVMMELHNYSPGADSSPAVKELEKAGYSIRFVSDSHVIAEPLTPPPEKTDPWTKRLS